MWIKKSEYELLTKSYIRLSKEIGDIRNELDRIKGDARRYEDIVKRHNRILEHSTRCDIGYFSKFIEGALSTYPYTDIYHDLKDYRFVNLYLYNPTFKISKDNNMIIEVKDIVNKEDERKAVYYMLDLKNKSFVCTKEDVIWKKE